MWKNMVDAIMKMKFRINKYSQVVNRVGSDYGGFAQFIVIDQYAGFPGEGHNFSFTDVEFYIVSSASAKCRYLEWATASHKSLVNTLNSRGPRPYSYGTSERTSQGEERIPETRT
jgi:hypothetical protein